MFSHAAVIADPSTLCTSLRFPYNAADVVPKPDGSLAIDFVMSTWNPYNDARMSASFRRP